MFDGGFMKNAHDQGLLGYDDVLLLMEEYTEENQIFFMDLSYSIDFWVRLMLNY